MNSAELWSRIVSSPRPSKVVDLPRSDASGETIGKVAMIVLTQEEQILAAADTERYTKKAIRDLPKADDAKRGYDDIYNNRAAVEILFRACRQVEDPSRAFFPSPEAIQQHLTADEVGVLFRSYLYVQNEIGPVLSHLSEEELNAWIRKLTEAGSRAPLAFLSSEALSDLVLSLASRIASSATFNTSPGSPLESGFKPESLSEAPPA